MDLRHRIVAACDEGVWTRQEIAEEYGVSTSWIRRLLQRRRERGNYKPLAGPAGRKPVFSGQAVQRLERLIAAQPDATLEELRDRSEISCSVVTVFNTLRRLGYRRKKRRFGPRSRIGRTLSGSAGHGRRKRVA
jgi:transposase